MRIRFRPGRLVRREDLFKRFQRGEVWLSIMTRPSSFMHIVIPVPCHQIKRCLPLLYIHGLTTRAGRQIDACMYACSRVKEKRSVGSTGCFRPRNQVKLTILIDRIPRPVPLSPMPFVPAWGDVILFHVDGKEPWNNPVRSRVWSMVLA